MINTKYILEFKNIIQKTNLQKGYQEQMKLFRLLRLYLKKDLTNYVFSGNIVENNMDYAYFQFTDNIFKSKGLKIVIVFIYKDFEYEVWMSGYNRNIQNDYFRILKTIEHKYSITENPNKTDYILRYRITNNNNFSTFNQLLQEIKTGTQQFINNSKDLL